MNPRKCLKRIFETFVTNATINNPDSQNKADNAFKWISSHFTKDEICKLHKTRELALNSKNSIKEFKATCREVRTRLFS